MARFVGSLALSMAFVATVIAAPRSEAQTSKASVVTADQFTRGRTWQWTYSGLDRATNEWQPYLIEHYTVAEVSGTKLTIEMRSSSVPYADSEPHHKFIVDFADCAKASADARFRNFKIAFYTKSLGNGWQLVSSSHTNLPFTEKFNCVADSRPRGLEESALGTEKIFRFVSPSRDEASWYFADKAGVAGVAAHKVFEPLKEYRFELTNFGE